MNSKVSTTNARTVSTGNVQTSSIWSSRCKPSNRQGHEVQVRGAPPVFANLMPRSRHPVQVAARRQLWHLMLLSAARLVAPHCIVPLMQLLRL